MFGIQPVGSVEDWYKALIIKDSGILYEDPYVQVHFIFLIWQY
jgi:AP-2 complex subunit alpha